MDWCGVVAVDKPAGMTSRRIVDHVVKIVRPAKVGHAGTLDPLATGVLVIAVGAATRLISYIQQGRKQYVGEFRLGQRSDTDDIEGQLSPGGDWSHVTEEMLVQAASKFVGVVSQVPPQFSAVHVDGQRAYDLARRGEAVELQARPVEVHSLRLSRFNPPDFELQIECGSGTYIRSIGRDLGEILGCGAVMSSLRRLAVGPFPVADAFTLEDLDVDSLQANLQPPLRAVAHLPRQVVGAAEISSLRQGRMIQVVLSKQHPPGTEFAIINISEELIGIGILEPDGNRLQPRIIFSM